MGTLCLDWGKVCALRVRTSKALLLYMCQNACSLTPLSYAITIKEVAVAVREGSRSGRERETNRGRSEGDAEK